MLKNIILKNDLFGRNLPARFERFDNLLNEISDLIPKFPYKDDFGGSILTNWTKKPEMNVSKTENEYTIELFVPGLSKEDIKIELNDDILTIKGKKKIEKTDKKSDYFYSEFSYSGFERSLTLPEDTDTVNKDTINAKYENGVLILTIPRIEGEKNIKTTREIKID